MKKLYLILLLYFCAQAIQAIYDPLLVIVIMVKDEAPVIRQTLLPFVQSGLHHFLVFDTGSTDDTIAITRQLFNEYNVQHGVIAQEPFIDFATSRNRGLQLAEEAFPGAGFLLMLDAEWYIHNIEGLIAFCQEHQHEKWCEAYLIRLIMNEGMDFGAHRLIRAHSTARFIGVVHEVFNWGGRNAVPNDVYFAVNTSQYGSEKTQRRWFRDAGLLVQEYERNPQDPRTIFYLAQTFECLGDWQNAAHFYKKRAATAGWEEENYMAQYRLAIAYDVLNKWDKALKEYLLAFCMRPHRIEPLVRIANHYWATGNYGLAYLFAQRALQIPYPDHDILFIDKGMYEYDRYELMSRVAWYVGEYELGKVNTEKALEVRPNEKHLHFNLQLYVDKIASL